MIVITGATGALGSLTVEALLRRVPASEVGVSVRDPQRAAHLADRGVRVRRGDFADPESLATAFEGATSVLVTSVDELGRQDLNVGAARIAQQVGVERVFYTAHQNTSPDTAAGFGPDHAATEEQLATLGVRWTSLRNGFYAHTLGYLIGGAVERGELALPADGPISWTAREDLAEGAAALLAVGTAGLDGRVVDGPVFDGPTPPLTATEAVTFDDVARILTDVSGATVRRTVVDDEEWVARSTAAGMPEAAAHMLLGLFVAARAGDFDVVGPALTELIGHPTQPVRTAVERALSTPHA